MSLLVTAPYLWTAGTIFPVVCTVVVAARFAVRRVQRGQRRRLDDWLTLPSLVLIWGMAATILAGTAQRSLGFPTPLSSADDGLTTDPPQETIVRKVYWAMTLLQIAALACIKTSCMLFFKRIFRTGTERKFDAFCYAYIILTIGWFLAFFFAFAFTCGTNFNYAWGPIAQAALCPANFVMVDQGMSYMDLILDVVLLVFPLPYIWRLQLNTARKLLVSFIFFLGSLAVLASVARVIIIVMELNVIFDETADQDLLATAVIYFMYLEACFALCASCLPSLSGFLKIKAVQNLVAGFSAMLSRLSSSGNGSGRGASEHSSKKAARANSSASNRSEPEIVLTSAAADAGKADNWVSHDGINDIEMAPRVPQNRIQVSRTWELSPE